MSTISVVIPTSNRPAFLKQAVESVLNQSRKPDEVIILDNNYESNVNKKMVEPFLNKFSFIRYKRNRQNAGVIENYRKAFELASCDYVKLLADNAVLHPDALLLMEKALDENPDCGLAVSPVLEVDEKLRFENLLSFDGYGRLDGKFLIVDSLRKVKNIFEKAPLLVRKKLIDKKIFNSVDLKINLDWWFWMHLASVSGVFYFDNPLVMWCLDGKKQTDLINDLFDLQEKVGFILDSFFHRKLGVEFSVNDQVKSLNKLVSDVKSLLSNINERKDLSGLKRNFIEGWYSIKNNIFSWFNSLDKIEMLSREHTPVSVIIVTYNSSRYIKGCLESLLKVLGPDDEIIVIDNNSSDDTVNIVNSVKRSSFVPIKLIVSKENLGYSKGINEGIKQASKDYFVFVNPDTLVTKGMFEDLLKALEEKDVGAVGPVSCNVSYTQHYSFYAPILEYLFSGKELLENREVVAAFLKALFNDEVFDTRLLIGLCMAVKREVVERCGGLDEKLFLGMDDFEFSWRLREKGYKLKIVPSAFVYHYGHASFNTLPEGEGNKYQRDAVKNLWEKLIDYYGFGNVPCIEDMWGMPRKLFPVNFPEKKYNFMFNFSGEKKDRNWYINAAKILTEKPEIAVVTVTYFSSKDIVPLFASLKRSSYPLKLIVVDNSEDENEFKNLLNVAKTIFGAGNVKVCLPGEIADAKVVIIKNKNTGFAGGTNLGIKQALEKSIPFVWILNPDTAVAPNTAFELLKASLYTGVPVVTCEIRSMIDPSIVQYNGYVVNVDGVRDRAFYVKRVGMLSGSNIFCNSEVFKKVGLLDEKYFLYFEDNEFFARLLNAGIHPVYIPYTFILHKSGSSVEGYLQSFVSIYYFIRNMLYFYAEKKCEFPEKYVLSYYLKNSHNKLKLKSIVEAVFDFTEGNMGKKKFEFLDSIDNVGKSEMNIVLKDLSIDAAIKNLRNLLLSKPRKKDVFFEFLSLVKKKEMFYGRIKRESS
ncbi:glycosyltransferase [Desulfurobacterium sp.]